MIDLRIKDAIVVFPWGSRPIAAVDIQDGKIVSLCLQESGPAHRTIDADGLHLMPGAIDTHVHLNFLSEAENVQPEVDEIASESRAAALSGVTTMMVYYRRLVPYGDNLRSFIEQGNRSSSIDFGLHLGILIEDHLEHVETYVRDLGILSFKMYTCYKDAELRRFGVAGEDDGFILAVLQRVAGIPGAHVHVHCENDEITVRNTARVREHLNEYHNALAAWCAARPSVAEAEAIRRVAFLARAAGCRLFVPHVSSDAALTEIHVARTAAGREMVLAETCPQYLLLSCEDGPPGTWAKVNPPVRHAANNAPLVDALAHGEFDVVGTDHATTTRAGKDNLDVLEARPGFPGMATLFPALMTLVHQGRISIESVARLSQRAAEIFHLAGKGIIAPGFDADLVLVDPADGRVAHAEDLQSASDFTVFEGQELFGWPKLTMVRGRVVAEDRLLTDPGATGRYLARHMATGRQAPVAVRGR